MRFLRLFWTVEVFQYSPFTRHTSTIGAYEISEIMTPVWKEEHSLDSYQTMTPYSLHQTSHFCLPAPSHRSSEPTFVHPTHDLEYCPRTTGMRSSWQQAHVIQPAVLLTCPVYYRWRWNLNCVCNNNIFVILAVRIFNVSIWLKSALEVLSSHIIFQIFQLFFFVCVIFKWAYCKFFVLAVFLRQD